MIKLALKTVIVGIMIFAACSSISASKIKSNSSIREANSKQDVVVEPTPEDEEIPINVSIIQLLGNPDKYHGKKVQVFGIGSLELEEDILDLHLEDYEKVAISNGVSIRLDKKSVDYEDAQWLNGKHVRIIGMYNKDGLSFNGGGAIEKIERYSEDKFKRKSMSQSFMQSANPASFVGLCVGNMS